MLPGRRAWRLPALAGMPSPTLPLAAAEPPRPTALPTTAPAYDRVAVALHWAVAALLLAQLTLGWWMLGLPKQPPGLRAGWFNVHKSLGLLLAGLVLLRLAWRLAHLPPPWPREMAAWQRRAADTTHRLLYAAMAAMPLTGFLGSSFGRYPIRAFGMELPRWAPEWPAAKALFATAHQASAWLLVGLLALHLGAAAWHAWQRDRTLQRMLHWHPPT